MKKFNKSYIVLGLALAALTSCSDVADEITEIVFPRNLSPVEVEARNVGEDKATLRWKASDKATAYIVEVFADDSLTFANSPQQTITVAENTAALSKLVYDTKYSARVKAITEGNESRDSKWSTVFFRTSAQQLMKSFKEENIADRSVTVTWDVEAVGKDLTTLKAFDADGKQAATKTLSADEVAAGKAVLSGLTPETQYTIRMYFGEKERGNRVVTTIADLNGATVLHPGDDIKAVIDEAAPGTVIALYGGEYDLNPTDEGNGSVVIANTLTIKGIYPTNKPVLKGRFQMNGGAGLSLSQLVIDGSTNATGDQTFNYKDADITYGALDLQDVEIKNFVKGICYGNVVCTIESITFNNCLIHDITCEGGDFFDLRKSYAKKVTFSNSTIWNVAQERDFIRYDDASSNYTDAAPVITVDHCTINNVLNDANAKRLLYVRFVGNSIKWTNNLVTNTKAVYSNQSKTSLPEFSNNYYFGCNTNMFAADDEASDPKVYFRGDTSGKNGEDPKYADAANGNFKLGNDGVSSKKVGDPRWY